MDTKVGSGYVISPEEFSRIPHTEFCSLPESLKGLLERHEQVAYLGVTREMGESKHVYLVPITHRRTMKYDAASDRYKEIIVPAPGYWMREYAYIPQTPFS